jgi:hypothetical protein
MASIADLQFELERLNDSVTRLVDIQSHEQILQSAGGTPTDERKDRALLISLLDTGVRSLGIVRDALRLDLGNAMKSAVDLLGNISQITLSLGMETVQKLDSLEYQQVGIGSSARGLVDLMGKETEKLGDFGEKFAEQAGGIEANLKTIISGQRKGFDFTANGTKTLRNQLTELNRMGGQGELLLMFTQRLTAHGFTRDQAMASLQRLSDIGMYSLQTAESQTMISKKLDDFLTLESVGSQLGPQMNELFINLGKDMPELNKKAFADIANLIFTPGRDQLGLRALIGGTELENELKALAIALNSTTDPLEQNRIIAEAERVFTIAAERVQDQAGRFFPAGTTGEVRGPLLEIGFHRDLANLLGDANLVIAGFNAQLDTTRKRMEDPGLFIGNINDSKGIENIHMKFWSDTYTNMERIRQKVDDRLLTQLDLSATRAAYATIINAAADATILGMGKVGEQMENFAGVLRAGAATVEGDMSSFLEALKLDEALASFGDTIRQAFANLMVGRNPFAVSEEDNGNQ